MRCLVKNLAMFGLGLDLFTKADLLQNVDNINNTTGEKKTTQAPRPAQQPQSSHSENTNFFDKYKPSGTYSMQKSDSSPIYYKFTDQTD
jgi:hypothetical protein